MIRPWTVPAVRSFVYLYFAIGVAAIVSGPLFVVTAIPLASVLALATWKSFGTPMSLRLWLPLCAVATLGFIRLVAGFSGYGGSVL